MEQEIRKGQMGDAKIQEIKDLITEVEVRNSRKMSKAPYGSRTRYVFLILKAFVRLFYRRPMTQIILFILVVPRCIRI